MTIEEFGRTIKQKYPQYQKLDDIEVADRVLKKYPQYASSLSTPQKAQNTGVGGVGGVALGLGKSALNTARGTAQLLQGAGQGVLGAISNPLNPREGFRNVQNTTGFDSLDNRSRSGRAVNEMLEPRGGAEQAGSFVGDVAQFAVPSAKVGKLSKGAGLLQRTALQAGTSGLVASMQEGEVGREAGIAAGTDVALPVVGRALKPVANFGAQYGKGFLKGLAGFTTGKGGDVIERVFKNPEAAGKGLRGDSNILLKEAATSVRQGVKNLKKQANEQYTNLVKSANVKGTTLNLSEVRKRIDDLLTDELDVVLTPKGVEIKNTPLLASEEQQIGKIYDKIRSWTDNTPEGINKLATSISKFRRGSQDSGQFDRIVDSIRRSVREYVGDKAPAIAEANQKFMVKMDLIEELDSILKTKGAVDSRQGIRETSQRVARLFNANKELSREAVEELEKEIGIDVLSIEAGRQLSDVAPRSLSSIGDLSRGILQTLLPPRIVGEVVQYAGRGTRGAQSLVTLIQQIPNLEPTARGALLEFMTEVFGGEDEQQENQ